MTVIMKILINAVAVILSARFVPGIVLDSTGSAILFVVMLTLLNSTLGALIRFGGIIFNALTLGIFNWIVNVVIIMLTANLVNGIHIDSWPTALILAAILALVNNFINAFDGR